MKMNDTELAKFPALGQLPSAAISPAAEFVPAPGFPPSAYAYTCVVAVQV